MNSSGSVRFHSFVLWGVLCVFGPAASRASEEALNLQVQLVWATNSKKPDDRNLRDLDPGLRDKLQGVFKWSNYYEVSHQTLCVTPEGPKQVRMSQKCVVEVSNLGKSRVEVKLFGKGNLVVQKRQALNSREPLVLAGDDKDGNAWFVVITLVKP